MIPGRVTKATRVLRAPKDWDKDKHGTCGGLPIRDETTESGLPVMVSVWLPSSEELAAMMAGASVTLRIIGEVHPPVSVSVAD